MPAIVKNGGPWPLVVLGWGALSAYCALYFGAFGWLSSKVWAWAKDEGCAWRPAPRWPYARRIAAILVAEPLVWCGLELLRSRLLGGFAWNPLGLPLANANFGSPAAIGGVYALSAVVVLVNGTIAGIAERMMRRAGRWAFMETRVPFASIWGLCVAGGRAVDRARSPDGAREMCVAMVQRNFPCVFQRDEAENPVEVYSNLVSAISHTRPEVVVLSESALCEFGAVDSPRACAFARWIAGLAGAEEVIAGGGRRAGGKEYNSAGLYRAGRIAETYDKVHLVPFGEFIPGDKWITALQKLAPVGSCTPGELKLLGGWGVAICYEDTDSAQMRALARKGAKALVFITNDSWFSRSVEAEQHAWHAVPRAIETGLAVVRTGNSGVTGTVSPDGRASWLAGADGRPTVDARGTICDRIPVSGARRTPYLLWGDVPLAVAFALVIGVVILVKYRDNHEKRRYLSMQ
jgi:apolipoprotein N-acyltransferase